MCDTFQSDNIVRTGLEIAVIGMAGRFPGAENIEQFWENLKNGVESISFLSDRELKDAGFHETMLENPKYVKSRGGVLEGKEYFDALFFGYTPIEAQLLNPHVRVFYECSWEALENAAYDPFLGNQVIGVYAGAEPGFFWETLALLSGKGNVFGSFATSLLTGENTLCTRVSYHLNLKGPAVAVQTACSTSLVAIHLACQALLNGECNIALAGGVTVLPIDSLGYHYREGMITSPDGHCRAFDAKARGMAGGEGCGVVVLKLLEQAIEDGDFIHALIKSSSINNDGIRKIGYTAPSVVGQAEAINIALQMAQVEPESVTYVETHGTGTTLGDPIEIKALTRAFKTGDKQYCALGSVKSNVGHLGSAAGVTGFIKTVLALKHHLIPPSLHFENPNPEIEFENTPFFVNQRLMDWSSNGYPLRAGVSSFGIGGTNAHVILEEAPLIGRQRTDDRPQKREYQLILLSAKTESALEKIKTNLAEYLKKNPDVNLADAAYTLQVGRHPFEHRAMIVCSSREPAIEMLSADTSRGLHTHRVQNKNLPVIFVFPGLGGQYVNMGRELYEKEPLFRKEMDRCFEILGPLTDPDIKEILYPFYRSNRSYTSDKSHINQTDIAQLVVFIFEYALAKLLIKWGITPYAMIGYSFGQYTAACIAGVFSLEDALKLIVIRGQLMKETPPGVMLSVPLTREELQPILPPGLSLAIDNGPSCVVAGTPEEVSAFETILKKRKCMTVRLEASHAIHSHMMESILKTFADALTRITLKRPEIPYISNSSGTWVSPREAMDSEHWAAHLRGTVRFAEGLQTLLEEPNAIFLEVGPGRDICALVNRAIEESGEAGHRVINLVKQRNTKKNIPGEYYLLNRIGMLWLWGGAIDWPAYYLSRGEKRYRWPLPTYPFEKQRFWELVDELNQGELKLSSHKFTGMESPRKKKQELADWFYVPSWKRQKNPKANTGSQKYKNQLCWLFFMDQSGVGDRLVKHLKANDGKLHPVIVVRIGSQYEQHHPFEYAVNPGQYQDYQRLFAVLNSMNTIPERIVHLWGVTGEGHKGNETERINKAHDLGFYSMLYLAKALGQSCHYTGEIGINVVTNGLLEVTGDEKLDPGKSSVLGPCRVIPQEYPGITCKTIDIPNARHQGKVVIQQLVEEIRLATDGIYPVVAFRGHHRWVQTFEPLHLEKGETSPLLREKGVYLIIGGLGDIGYTLAEYLVKRVGAKLIITGRRDLPPRNMGEQDNQFWQKIEHLQKIGGEVFYYPADVSDGSRMQEVIRQGESQLGPINGVIHSAGIIRGETFKPIAEITVSQCQQQFQAKIDGLMTLAELLKGKTPDFCLMISSISTVLGGLGFAAYSGANHFMDAFSTVQNQKNQVPWIIVDWEGTNKKDTADAFARILSAEPLQQVLFAIEGNLEERISRWVKLEGINKETKKENKKTVPMRSRPGLLNPYLPPGNELEQKLVRVWQDFFTIEKIGVTDDLFDLGGDSLKMIGLIAIIQKELKVTIPLQEFFDHPTIEHIARYIGRAEKEEFFSIEPVEEKEHYALSSAQKRLYILQEMEKTSTAYNSLQVLSLGGNFEPEQLMQAVRKLIQRHESLRTSIHIVNSEPVQKVHKVRDVPSPVDYFDVTPEPAPDVRVKTIIKEFLRPFDMCRAPFFRLRLVKVEEGQHVFMFDIHHLITDGITHEIFVRELMALYAGEELPLLRIQYKDYSQWQTSPRHQEVLAQQEAFWLGQFQTGEDIPVLVLPYDYPRPVLQGFAGDVIGFQLSRKETRALREIAAEEGVTLYMVLMTIFNIFLFKLSSQDDIVVGTPMAGRRHAELEAIIGVFINTLPIRNYPSDQKSQQAFLQEIKQSTLQAFENQDYQFEDLVDKVVVHRDTGRNPLFDAVFVLQISQAQSIAGIPGAEVPGLQLQPYQGHKENTSKFDLTLDAKEQGDVLVMHFEYCTHLFKRETLERFVHYFKRIVGAMITDRHQCISHIDILPREEKCRMLELFGQAGAKYPSDKSLYQLLADQVQQTPDHIAVIGQSVRLSTQSAEPEAQGPPGEKPGKRSALRPVPCAITYRELNQRARQLSYVLKEKGVGPDSIVAIMMGRYLEMIIGIMGILKAGGAYLPIVPDYPEDRITYMLADSNAKILVTTPKFQVKVKTGIEEKGKQPQGVPLQIIDIGADFVSGPKVSSSTLTSTCQVSPANLAYIIYTSGTTGKPKGAMIVQQNVVQLMVSEPFRFDFNCGDVWTLFHSFCFDFSVWEMYGPLLYGGKVVVVDRNTTRAPAAFLKLLKREQVTVLNQTPSAFYNLSDQELKSPDTQLNLRCVIFGGEALKPTRLKEWWEKYPGINLINMFGITETTVHVTFKEIGADEILSSVSNIGKPLPTLIVYVLDKDMKLVPLGVSGECCVGGAGVARGYLNRPVLTREKFVDNPYKPGETLYRSGDLVRLIPAGEIEYLGRIDQQVKIRGFRIELGEIESQLLNHHAVKEAVVLNHKNENGDNHLYAFIVPGSPGEAPSTESPLADAGELREHLAMKLPDYMIPSHFLQVKQTPLTPNGKVDRKALFSANTALTPSKIEYVAPHSGIERQISEVWTDVLKCERVGRNDNFFDLGGNSLSVIQVVNHLKDILDIDIPVVSMFEYPTLSSLSQFLLQKSSTSTVPAKEEEVMKMRNQSSETRDAVKKSRLKQQASRKRRTIDA